MKNSEHNNLVSGIDIGSEKIYCSIGLRFPETSKVKLLGIGISPVDESFKKGTISNRNKLINQIEIAVNEAEIMADQKINNAYISLTGDHIKSMNTQSAIALNRNNNIENNSISQKDINRVLELTQGIALPPDRDILHTIPQEFIVDTLEKIKIFNIKKHNCFQDYFFEVLKNLKYKNFDYYNQRMIEDEYFRLKLIK